MSTTTFPLRPELCHITWCQCYYVAYFFLSGSWAHLWGHWVSTEVTQLQLQKLHTVPVSLVRHWLNTWKKNLGTTLPMLKLCFHAWTSKSISAIPSQVCIQPNSAW